MTNEEAINMMKMMMPPTRRGDGKSTTHLLQTLAISMAIDALQERKTGKWIEKDAAYICTACEQRLSKFVAYDVGGTYNYCPFCGAKMEVDDATAL